MKKIRLDILVNFYTKQLEIIVAKSAALVKETQDKNPNYHLILRDAKKLHYKFIVFAAKAKKFHELDGNPYSQMWAAEYEKQAAKNFDFLLN